MTPNRNLYCEANHTLIRRPPFLFRCLCFFVFLRIKITLGRQILLATLLPGRGKKEGLHPSLLSERVLLHSCTERLYPVHHALHVLWCHRCRWQRLHDRHARPKLGKFGHRIPRLWICKVVVRPMARCPLLLRFQSFLRDPASCKADLCEAQRSGCFPHLVSIGNSIRQGHCIRKALRLSESFQGHLLTFELTQQS